MKKNVRIENGDISLEGVMVDSGSEKAAIITHPHSLYGGDMHNNIVQSIAGIYSELGYSTLKFNFRGVGGSSGAYDNGVGEQTDLNAAIIFLESEGKTSIDLIGYSFGSWVIYNYVTQNQVTDRVIFVSPPVDFIPFAKHALIASLSGIIVGDRDEFASIDSLSDQMTHWKSDIRLDVVQGADHFYSGKTAEFEKTLSGILKNQ